MALGIEGSKGILYSVNTSYEEEKDMAVGFEGSKGILHNGRSDQSVRATFQELTWRAAWKEFSFGEFMEEIRKLPPRMSVSAFANDQCDLGCPHCYLRTRGRFAHRLPVESDIVAVANALGAADFSIVGMEPLETWERTQNLLRSVKTERKAMITNARYLTPEVVQWLAESDTRVDFSIGGSKAGYEGTLRQARLLADTGVKATASCVILPYSVPLTKIARDISALGFPLVLFPFCDISESEESGELVRRAISMLLEKMPNTKTLVKIDFLSPHLLSVIWKEYFSGISFADLRIDMDEGFLVRQLSDKLFLGAYPFPGEFINRVRIDADGSLTTCHHMQLPLAERLAIGGDLRFRAEGWLDILEIRSYHERYWESYRRQ